MHEGLRHAPGITPFPLHPLDARSRVQVAGERAANHRDTESCGQSDAQVYTRLHSGWHVMHVQRPDVMHVQRPDVCSVT